MERPLVKKAIAYSTLAFLSIASLAIALPAIGWNINEPNLITYLNQDEGYQMDLVWYYYSGEKRDSFQYDTDYGLELFYLSDFAHLALSKFITIRAGIFALILRWLHLLAWLVALMILWRLARHHLSTLWQPTVLVLLLGTNPALGYLLNNSKPEPLVLLFMLVGLDYTLRMIDNRPRLYFAFAAACGAAAFIVKFAGIFLLPAIVAAMYFTSQCEEAKSRPFPALRSSWAFPGLCGFSCLGLSFAIIFLYHRRTTGLTWYQEYGLIQTLVRNRILFYVMALGLGLVVVSAVLWLLNKVKSASLRRWMGIIDRINSYSLTASLTFIFFCAILGSRWIIKPLDFISLYAQTGREAFELPSKHLVLSGNILVNFLKIFIFRLRDFNIGIFLIFIFYLVNEFIMARKRLYDNRSLVYKRLTLLVFLIPFFIYMGSGVRAAGHHMLPFFAVAAMLGLEGLRMAYSDLMRSANLKKIYTAFSISLLAAIIIWNVVDMAKFLAERYSQREEIAFDIAKWWLETYPYDTSIVADHPVFAYLPSGYKNVKYLKFQHDRVKQLPPLVSSFKPRLIYLNMGVYNNSSMPPIEEILPDVKTRAVRVFNAMSKRYQRWPAGRYVVYEVTY